MLVDFFCFFLFFFTDTATTEIYTLSLHDALPISVSSQSGAKQLVLVPSVDNRVIGTLRDRKSTRLNSSHGYISYAVFCLKKKKKNKNMTTTTTMITDLFAH